MIVFSVAFGKTYLANLFERCLPSLIGGKPTYLGDEPIRVAIFTLTEFIPFVQEHLGRSALLSPYIDSNRCDVFAYEIEEKEKHSTAVLSGGILEKAIIQCLRRGESWAHAVPDLVYAANALETCWALHKITGKVVAIFNGRVNAEERGTAFTTEDYLRATAGMPNFFFGHMTKAWREHYVTTLGDVKGSNPGELVVDSPALRAVFATAVNPFVGRFEPEDRYAFPRPQGFGHWDHSWKDTLERTHRLVVQTDLDAAMSIEPATQKDIGKFERQRSLSEILEDTLRQHGSPEIARRLKFGAPGMHYFTTATMKN
jgi:hypothetical protein